MTDLPVPAPGRFKPLRAGLVDLFLYEAQEFRFRDGRLLLRGDNGSGKSKVMALTLPLLLDANLSPARMEPDADPKKRMDWNLLQGGEYDERTGYSWLEFGRLDEIGRPHIVTLGLGVKAVAQRGVVKQWWFVTDRRVGEDLFLVDRLHTVLTRERLIEALGEHGTVFDTAERYRRAVDEALFSLHDRYEALVDLLVHLRQPQLSKRPDEEQLARALSESLAPLSPALVGVVAESYQALDDDERELARLRSSAGAVAAFSAEYLRYARIAAARAARVPRQAQSAYEASNRDSAEAAQRVATAEEATSAAETALQARSAAVTRSEAQREALRERLGADELRELDTARVHAQQTAGAAASAASSRARQEVAATAARRDAEAAEAAATDAERDLRTAAREFTAAADTAGVPLETADLQEPDVPESHLGALRQGVGSAVDRRRRQLDDLERRRDARTAAATARAGARIALDAATAALDQERDTAEQAAEAAEATASAWLEAVRAHLTTTVELGGGAAEAGLEQALEAAEAWLPDPVGQNAVLLWAAEAQQLAHAALAAERAGVQAAADRLGAPIAALEEEVRSLSAGRVVRPPVPAFRTGTRDPQRGAAFWECVDVLPGVPGEALGGIEAALEAAGLLDAWVSAEGELRDDAGDTLLVAAPRSGSTLAAVLRPTPPNGAPVAPGLVATLLASIGLTDSPAAGDVAVSTSGRFALGPLVGAAMKPAARFIGATARDQARRDRLAAAIAERDALDTERTALRSRVARLGERLGVLAGEFRAVPGDLELRAARDRATAAAERIEPALERAGSASARLQDATSVLDGAERDLADAVGEYGVAPDRIAAVREALRDVEYAARRLERAVRDRMRALAGSAARQTAAATAAESAAIASADAAVAEQLSIRVAERLATLESTVGVEVRELESRLAALDDELGAGRLHLEQARGELTAAREERAVALDRREAAREAADQAAAVRTAAAAGFRRFADTGFLRLAAPDVALPGEDPWAPDPTVRLARRVADALDPAVEDDAWNRAGTRLLTAFESLQTALSAQGTQVAREVRHGVVVVEVQHHGAYVTPDELAEELADALAERERLLSERERAILQNHLIDEVGAQLQTRVQDAVLQVERMNRELDRRPTRSGLKLRIMWQPVDDDQSLARRRLLQRSAAAWSPADREAIGAMLTDRIQGERIADPDGTWHERLGRAFDYRSWNRFSVQIHQNGAWRPASGPASGGERVLAASVPLFAAAASHYGSAGNPHAPRLILLDEAFAGVDDRSRASYLGLLAEFDLDVMMTSEREWATYPEVPGIAIAQLFRLPGAKAVHVDHWEWDGAERLQVLNAGPSAVAPAVSRPDAATVALDFEDAMT